MCDILMYKSETCMKGRMYVYRPDVNGRVEIGRPRNKLTDQNF